MTGIEPASSAWEADILPMNYICLCLEHDLLYHKFPIWQADFFDKREIPRPVFPWNFERIIFSRPGIFYLQHFVEEADGPLFFRMAEHFFRCSFFYNISAVHKDHPVSHFSGKPHLMSHHHHGHAVCRQLLHNL